MELRQYQIDDLATIREELKKHKSVLYSLPTGGGKSVILSTIIDENSQKNILVLAHKKRLLTQLENHLTQRGLTPGLIFTGVKKNLDSSILIASIKSVVRDHRLDEISKTKWDYIIIDEARHSRTGSYDKVLKTILSLSENCKLLGVDATPYRKDKKRLDEHFEVLVNSSEDIKSLIEKGFLADIKTFASPIGDITFQVKETAGDYVVDELSKYMRHDKFLDYLVSTYQKFGESRQTIIFAVDIEHSKAIVERFQKEEEFKGKIAQVNSTMNQVKIDETIEKYEKGEFQFLVNVEMLTEGVDLPETACIIGARPTKSLTLYLQMVGRGTRPKQDGKQLILLDCCGWTQEYGQVSTPRQWSLNPEIDPNHLRAKTKVFGLDKDGNLIEDLSSYVGEVIELTPEEYIGRLSGGIEEARKVNQTIEQQIHKVGTDFIEQFMKAIGVNPTELDIAYEVVPDQRNKDVEILFTTKRTKEGSSDFEVKLQRNRYSEGFYSFSQYSSPWGLEFAEQRSLGNILFLAALGNIHLSKTKAIHKKIGEHFQEILLLESTKINIEQLESEKDKIDDEKILKELSFLLKTEGIKRIELPREKSLSDYTSDYGYFSAIELPDLKIKKYHNTVKFFKKDGSFYKQKDYLTGEVVERIILKGGYGRTSEEK